MGHTEPITQLQTVVMRHVTRGTPMRYLVSGSKDGLLKAWDLEQQKCVGTFSDTNLGKVQDFVMIGELSILVAAGQDQKLFIFKVENSESGLKLVMNSDKLQKESGHRTVQMLYVRRKGLLFCLSADNKIEVFGVNVDRPEAIIKKLARQAKKSLKRTHTEAGLSEDKEIKVDKDEISDKISQRDYDFSVHFSRDFATVVEAEHKARAFAILSNSECIVALHNNRCLHYKLAAETSKQLATLGELATH